MLALNSRPQQNISSADTILESRPAGFQSLKQRQSLSIIKYGGKILGKFIPLTPRRPVKPFGMIPSRPSRSKPLSPSISSLASATLGLVDFTHIQRMQQLSEAADSAIKGMLAFGRIGLLDPGVPLGQGLQSAERSDLLSPSSDISLSVNHHDHSDLSLPMPILLLPPALSETTEQDRTAIDVIHSVPPVADPDIIPLSRVIPVLPGAEVNVLSSPSNGNNISARPVSIPQHMRPWMRPPTQIGPLSDPISQNHRRFPAFPPTRSSSSLLSTTTYVTAPTGTSPPPSLRSILRCESPGPLPEMNRRDRVHSFQSSTLRQSIVADDLYYRVPWPSYGNPDPGPAFESQASTFNAPAPSNSNSRKILIIGNSYKGNSELKRVLSLETLDGAFEDRNLLKTVFQERSYSVQTLFDEGFNRERALSRVAQFLKDAESGDVRAIVFTGHGLVHEDGTTSLVPPGGSQMSDVITRAEWDKNIRDHSSPGVVVLSIMAHCFSGEMMRQEFDRQAWPVPTPTTDAGNDGPIYLTFAASEQTAYESWVTRNPGPQSARACDHFIHALVGAIKSINVATGTWDEFFETFDRHFQRARSCASWQDKQVPPSVPSWRSDNHQSPRFSASGFIVSEWLSLSDINGIPKFTYHRNFRWYFRDSPLRPFIGTMKFLLCDPSYVVADYLSECEEPKKRWLNQNSSSQIARYNQPKLRSKLI